MPELTPEQLEAQARLVEVDRQREDFLPKRQAAVRELKEQPTDYFC